MTLCVGGRENWPLGVHVDGLEAYYHVAMGVYWHFIIFQVCACLPSCGAV